MGLQAVLRQRIAAKMLSVLALLSAALVANGQAAVPRLGGVNTAGFDFTVVCALAAENRGALKLKSYHSTPMVASPTMVSDSELRGPTQTLSLLCSRPAAHLAVCPLLC